MKINSIEEIKELARLMQETGLTEIDISENGVSVRLHRQNSIYINDNPNDPSSIGIIGGADGPTSVSMVKHDENLQSKAAEETYENPGVQVLSPTVGVFYSAASPDSEPYVQVGDKVQEGDILCIIEAMKLMNEIQADTSGTIAEIYVGNGQVVEYDQPLFRIV